MTKFNFSNTIILEDDRVLLRPITINDYDNLCEFSLSEPEIWEYSSLQAIGEIGLKNYLEKAMEASNEKKELAFIVFDKQKNSYAGSTRFYDIQLQNKCLLIGFTWYGKQFQGTGLNKHCKFLLLKYAFEIMEIERVEFRADNDNKKSIAAMLSIGCTKEGILRSNGFKPNGERRDSIVLSILKNEWFGFVKQNLIQKLNSI